MPETVPSLLLTRPRAQADRFARRFAARFGPAVPIIVSPLIEVEIRPLTIDPAGFAGLIFTSENGVHAFAGQSALRHHPAYCVGPTTAEAARQAGFAVQSTQGGTDGLLALLRGTPVGPLLHLHGEHVAGTLAADLTAAGTDTGASVIYAQPPRPLTREAAALLARPGLVLLPLFSARTAQLFDIAAATSQASLLVAALSDTVARGLTRPVVRLVIATQPDGDSLLDALAALMNAGSTP